MFLSVAAVKGGCELWESRPQPDSAAWPSSPLWKDTETQCAEGGEGQRVRTELEALFVLPQSSRVPLCHVLSFILESDLDISGGKGWG